MGLTLQEIQFAVGEWSRRNFLNNTPLEPMEGLVEELGECAHARLKRRQGIRHTPEECVAMERDAIGDMGIYLCDFASRMGIALAASWEPGDDRPDMNEPMAFATLAESVGRLAYLYHDGMGREYMRPGVEYVALRVAARLVAYAHFRGWDFLDILNETWARVGKRDWRADPIAGGGEAS